MPENNVRVSHENLEMLHELRRAAAYQSQRAFIDDLIEAAEATRPLPPLSDGWYLLDNRIPYYNQGGRLFERHESGALIVAHMNDFARERFTPLSKRSVSREQFDAACEVFEDAYGVSYPTTLANAFHAAEIEVE